MTPWTVACQAPLSTGILQAKILQRVSRVLLQEIFPTQESDWGLLHCRRILYQLNYQGTLTQSWWGVGTGWGLKDGLFVAS